MRGQKVKSMYTREKEVKRCFSSGLSSPRGSTLSELSYIASM